MSDSKMNDEIQNAIVTLNTEINKLFEHCISEPNELYPSNWKHIVLELQQISNSNYSPFDNNARNGFNYLGAVVYNTVCNKCHDKKAFIWFKDFAKAWLENTSLPEFPKSCWFSEVSST